MKTTVLLLAVALSASVSAQETWTPKTSCPGGAKWGMACFDINGIGYMVGGRTASGTDLNELWAYDPIADIWQQKASIPGTRRLASSFSLGSKGYVTCGLTGSGTALNDTWEYNPSTDTWTAKATLPATIRYNAASFTINGQGYVCSGGLPGGANGPYSSELWRYDPVTNLWSARAALPDQGRVGAAGFSADGIGFVFSGRQLDQTFTNELWAYDPNTNSWSTKATMPGVPSSCPETYSVGNKGVVVGGHGINNDPFACWYYIPGTDSWTALPNYIGSGTWTGANMAIGNRIFAGFGQGSGSTYGDFYELAGLTLGVQEIPFAPQTAIYPNPCASGGQLMVKVSQAGTNITELDILNALGQRMAVQDLILGEQTITLPHLAAGTYVCMIKQKGIPVGRLKLDVIQ